LKQSFRLAGRACDESGHHFQDTSLFVIYQNGLPMDNQTT
jgi:hypothetical protein